VSGAPVCHAKRRRSLSKSTHAIPYDFGSAHDGRRGCRGANSRGNCRRADCAGCHGLCHVQPGGGEGPLSIANICRIAKAKARQCLWMPLRRNLYPPNIHIQAGASLVATRRQMHARSAGCRRASRRSRADPRAWFRLRLTINYGRGYKVGKEESWGCWPRCASGTSGTTRRRWKEWPELARHDRQSGEGSAFRHNEISQPEDLFQPQPGVAHALGCECAEDYRHGVRSEIGCGHASHHDRQRHRHQA